MINTHELLTEKKVDFILREIIMGDRTEFDFNKQLISTDNKGHLARCLHNINRNNYHDHAHYLVEMGYLNVFHQDVKVGKKLRAWYETQLKHVHKHGYIQLFCILHARSEPMFDKYGKSEAVEINYFDVITSNYKENSHRLCYCSKAYGYMALNEYAAIISKIIAAWQSVPAEERAAQTRADFKIWLENEKEFIEKIHVVEEKRTPNGWDGQYERRNYEQKKEKLLTAIEEAVQLFDKDVNCKL